MAEVLSLNPKLISIRDLTAGDIPHLVYYWYHSPVGYLEGIGVDPKKLPSEDVFEKGLREKCHANAQLVESRLNAAIILYDGEPIGFHTINPVIEGDYGIFHAHIWDPKFRNQGIARHSYPMACDMFFERFGLNKILFKTPAQNVGAIRVKKNLGIRYIGEEIVSIGIIRDSTLAQVIEISRAEAKALVLQRQRNLSSMSFARQHLGL